MKRKTPTKRMPPVPPEHNEQAAFFRFLALLAIDNPDVGLAYAIPNGGKRHIGTARKLQEEGVKPGVPDICWPVPRYPFHGLYLEMKRVKGGKVSDAQKPWVQRLREQGYKVEICKGFEAAKKAFCEYLALSPWGKTTTRGDHAQLHQG